METARLSIKRISDKDWEQLRRICSDFSAGPYALYDAPIDTSDENMMRMAVSMSCDEDSFGVYLRGSDVMIGYYCCHRHGEEAELGYCFDSAYHRRGYAYESALAVMEHYRQTGVKRLTAGTAVENVPSMEMLLSLGFVRYASEYVSFYKDDEGDDIFFEGALFEKYI